MTFTLYAATIPNNLQVLGAVAALITKAEAWCNERGLPPEVRRRPGQVRSGLTPSCRDTAS